MTYGLEDKIIAYFDGQLSDADSAELLHLVSVSPEIRYLFRQHEMLRELAHKATSSVIVKRELEFSLLDRVKSISGNTETEKPFLVFSRRTASIAALALILISGSLGYLILRLFSTDSPQLVDSKGEIISHPGSIADMAHSDQTMNLLIAKKHDEAKNTLPYANSSLVHAERLIIEKPNKDLSFSEPSNEVTNGENPSNGIFPQIQFVLVREEGFHLKINNERHSPFELHESIPDSRMLFEVSAQTSSGFTYPANLAPIKPFADQRLSFAYHVTENNLIGFRLGSGLYEQLGNVTRQEEDGVEVLHRSISTIRSFSEGLYLSHLIPLLILAPFAIEISLDGGLIPNGYTIGAEAGIRIPLSQSFFFDAAFALSRVHSNALSSQEILSSESMGMKPVILDGVDIHNTLNGRLHYGLIYRF